MYHTHTMFQIEKHAFFKVGISILNC